MAGLQYTTVMKVYKSWAIIKGADQVLATEALYKRLFELAPEARNVVNFDDGSSPFHDQDMKVNSTFLLHAWAVFDMLDLVVNSLGPDLEPLADELEELGKRHVGRGSSRSTYD